MTKTRIVIGLTGKHVTGDSLVFELDDEAIARPVADAAAHAVAAGIRAQGDSWNKTGTLASGVHAVPAASPVGGAPGFAIVPPAGRLTRDPKLVSKLRAAVPALSQPFTPSPVRSAIRAAVAAIVSTERVP